MPLRLKWATIITTFTDWVYISTKAWLRVSQRPSIAGVTESSLINQNPASKKLVPGSDLACDNTDKRALGCLHIKVDGGGGCGRGRSDLISFMSAGASEESDAFSRCSPLFLNKKSVNLYRNILAYFHFGSSCFPLKILVCSLPQVGIWNITNHIQFLPYSSGICILWHFNLTIIYTG